MCLDTNQTTFHQRTIDEGITTICHRTDFNKQQKLYGLVQYCNDPDMKIKMKRFIKTKHPDLWLKQEHKY